jgi:uncharacterized DUF497 family protein
MTTNKGDALNFDWDAANRGKCQKHGVSLVEIEAYEKEDPTIQNG